MNTETTRNNNTTHAGLVLYDGDCGFCLRWLRRVERPLTRKGFRFETLQTHGRELTEMLLQLPDGRELGGADAAMNLSRHVWWLWPLWLVSRIPGVMPIFRAGYRVIAKNRHRFSSSCEIKPGGKP